VTVLLVVGDRLIRKRRDVPTGVVNQVRGRPSRHQVRCQQRRRTRRGMGHRVGGEPVGVIVAIRHGRRYATIGRIGEPCPVAVVPSGRIRTAPGSGRVGVAEGVVEHARGSQPTCSIITVGRCIRSGARTIGELVLQHPSRLRQCLAVLQGRLT